VLKLLQKSYAGKIKLIYIDPPYNTGKDFVYPDRFQDNIKNYLELTGQIEGEFKITSNTETSGRFHTDWLNMMYPRLTLAKNLLCDDGVIFISIDDAEFANLKDLCTQIYGEENFIASLIWEKGRKNDAKLVSVGHEYIIVFAKRKAFFQEKKIKWREAKPGAKEILDEYLRLRKLYLADNSAVEKGIRDFYESLAASHPSKKHSRYNKVEIKEYGEMTTYLGLVEADLYTTLSIQ
jgi:adenine-specific DNA-methyltransferase